MNATSTAPPAISEIIEYHEVPEGRVIHGHDMTFHAPVFGELVSDGGVIRLENSFGWGSAINPLGHIRARKRSFNATLQAPGGVIELASAESCLIIGRHVTVLDAVQCQIFAHTLRVGKATGCMIAGRDIEIRQAMPHKQEPNVITMVVPELPDIDAMLLPLIIEIEEMQVHVDELSSRINAFKADSALTHYLSIRSKVRTGMLQLTDDQSKAYLEMADRLDESAKALEGTVSERTPIAKKLAAAKTHAQVLRDGQYARVVDCRCNIANVGGETIVRQLLEAHDDLDLSLIPLPMIPKILFRNDASLKFLYAVKEGRVEWHAVAQCS